MVRFKVLISGAGLGGLCLAQTLRRHDVDVDVFERDKSPWDRPQGYRLHIDSDGVNALYQSLTPELYKLFDATSMKPRPFTTEDGTKAKGDLLVGADGIRSTVRKQRVPRADTQDTGVRAIYGRIPIIEALKFVPNQAREEVFTVAVDSKQLFLGLGPVVFPTRPDVAASQFMPKAELRPQDDYVVCIIEEERNALAKTTLDF
jgi:2-polyprenyl-6-methoxyphenol hydroxylase-like FAD-dependent oxidoreductase